MTPNPMKMTTPVRPPSCKPEPDITHSNETYMNTFRQLAKLREMTTGRSPHSLKGKEGAVLTIRVYFKVCLKNYGIG